jgi:predicted aconitase with swiveling domain
MGLAPFRIVINISDEVVQAAATLALTLLKKLPNVCMEKDLIGELVSNVRLNPVRPNVGSWCVFYKSRVFH